MRRMLVVLGLGFALACAHSVPAPPAPDPDRVVEVRVEDLRDEASAPRSLTDAERVRSIAGARAFHLREWQSAAGRALPPRLRVDLVDAAGASTTWWLGTNSDVGIFPCYRLCSGWWVAGSDSTGTLDASRYVGLADAVSMPLLTALDID